MQNQISVHIAQSCHEKWNRMTATAQGKFCSACSKQVIDFSSLTDQQILTILSNQSGKICGRFQESQLDRTLAETKVRKWKSSWLAYTLPLAILFQKSYAQKQIFHTKGKVVHSVKKEQTVEEMLQGEMTICEPVKKKTIQGKVIDKNNNPLRYASILVKETNQFISSDSAGRFSFDMNIKDSGVTLTASYIGFEGTEQRVGATNDKGEINIVMKQDIALLREAVVVSYASEYIMGRMGGISIGRRITTTEKIDSAFKKVLRISPYFVYPNPALKGNYIHIKCKEKGNYELQLMDNKSSLLTAQEMSNETDQITISFLIPDHISSGIYYLRIINLNTKKSSVEKLIIQ